MKKDEIKEPKVDSTLSKGLLILEVLTKSHKGKGVTELSKELGLTKSNTFRLLQTLTTLGYVKNSPDKLYSATLKTWQIGRLSLDNLNLRELAAPEMDFLAKETGETIYLAVPESFAVVYIDKIDSSKPIRTWNPIGGTAPLHCVGTGKAILAVNYSDLREGITDRLESFTDKTITDMKILDENIELTLKNSYAYDTGEFRENILSFGAAITMPDGKAIAALGISVPDFNFNDGDEKRFGSLVAHAAESVTRKLSRS